MIGHVREQLGERWQSLDECALVDTAKRFAVEDLRDVCRRARHAIDPDGAERDLNEDYERRWLHVSPMLDGMHSVDGVLDSATGEAFRNALDAPCLLYTSDPADERSK